MHVGTKRERAVWEESLDGCLRTLGAQEMGCRAEGERCMWNLRACLWSLLTGVWVYVAGRGQGATPRVWSVLLVKTGGSGKGGVFEAVGVAEITEGEGQVEGWGGRGSLPLKGGGECKGKATEQGWSGS